MYAAQLRFALERELGNMGEVIAAGRLPEIFDWLGRHIWSQGACTAPTSWCAVPPVKRSTRTGCANIWSSVI